MNKYESIRNAVALEKTMNKGTKSLLKDFVADIEISSAETIKKALKTELKKEGFIPSNTFTMKCLNTSIALFNAGIKAENVDIIVSFCRIKASEGERMTKARLDLAIEKYGNLENVINEAKKASTPEAKKAKKSESAKRGAQTRIENKKGGIVPSAVIQANQSADSAKAEKPLEQQATPAMKIDRAVNCFLALTDDERVRFCHATIKELNVAIATFNELLKTTKAKIKKAS